MKVKSSRVVGPIVLRAIRVVGPIVLRAISRVKEYFVHTSEIDRYLNNSVDHCDLENRMNNVARNNMKSHRYFYSHM
jgi:hypothetical protein